MTWSTFPKLSCPSCFVNGVTIPKDIPMAYFGKLFVTRTGHVQRRMNESQRWPHRPILTHTHNHPTITHQGPLHLGRQRGGFGNVRGNGSRNVQGRLYSWYWLYRQLHYGYAQYHFHARIRIRYRWIASFQGSRCWGLCPLSPILDGSFGRYSGGLGIVCRIWR